MIICCITFISSSDSHLGYCISSCDCHSGVDTLSHKCSLNIYLSILAKAREEDWLPEEPVHHHRQTIQLWQFLKQLLLQPALYSDCIKWVDRAKGIFKIENSTRVAKLWGKRKNRPAMNYDKLSRSIRQYYKKKIITKPVITKRLVYQFCKEYL